MSNLVDRLREKRWTGELHIAKMTDAAADKIERQAKRIKELEAELNRFRSEDNLWKHAQEMGFQIANDELEAENERLRKALAESCDENRHQVIEEGPWSTDMCPIAGKLSAENERLTAALNKLKGGCGSHSCRREKPKGMGVNGPCRCWARIDEALAAVTETGRINTE